LQAWDCQDFCFERDANSSTDTAEITACVKCAFVRKSVDEKFDRFDQILTDLSTNDDAVRNVIRNCGRFKII
jgi:hypothetical protein